VQATSTDSHPLPLKRFTVILQINVPRRPLSCYPMSQSKSDNSCEGISSTLPVASGSPRCFPLHTTELQKNAPIETPCQSTSLTQTTKQTTADLTNGNKQSAARQKEAFGSAEGSRRRKGHTEPNARKLAPNRTSECQVELESVESKPLQHTKQLVTHCKASFHDTLLESDHDTRRWSSPITSESELGDDDPACMTSSMVWIGSGPPPLSLAAPVSI